MKEEGGKSWDGTDEIYMCQKASFRYTMVSTMGGGCDSRGFKTSNFLGLWFWYLGTKRQTALLIFGWRRLAFTTGYDQLSPKIMDTPT